MRGGYGRRMRDGDPLPGVTPPEVTSQLTHRVFGPLQPNRVRQVLDYQGLAGHPAGTRTQIATRHQVSGATVTNQVRAVRAQGAKLPLTTVLITDATRPSEHAEDHLGQVRIADTLGLPRPAPPESAPLRTRVPRSGSSAGPKVAGAAARILAAIGQLDLDTLLEAVERSRRFRDPTPVTATDLATALTTVGALSSPDGHWAAPPGVTIPGRYQVIVAAAGRDMTRAEMIDVLIGAGYSRNSATGRMSSSHPLLQRVGPNRYRVISARRGNPK